MKECEHIWIVVLWAQMYGSPFMYASQLMCSKSKCEKVKYLGDKFRA